MYIYIINILYALNEQQSDTIVLTEQRNAVFQPIHGLDLKKKVNYVSIDGKRQ